MNNRYFINCINVMMSLANKYVGIQIFYYQKPYVVLMQHFSNNTKYLAIFRYSIVALDK